MKIIDIYGLGALRYVSHSSLRLPREETPNTITRKHLNQLAHHPITPITLLANISLQETVDDALIIATPFDSAARRSRRA